MESESSCHCGSVKKEGPPLIFACSGAADVGELTDRAARRLTREKSVRMLCTSAIGANVDEYIFKTESSAHILLLDGCEHHCAKHVLESAGFLDFEHLCLSNYGFVKERSPASDENVCRVMELCISRLQDKQTTDR